MRPRGLTRTRQLDQLTDTTTRSLRAPCGIPTELPQIEDWAARISDDRRGRSRPDDHPDRTFKGDRSEQSREGNPDCVQNQPLGAERNGRASVGRLTGIGGLKRIPSGVPGLPAEFPQIGGKNAGNLRARAARISAG